MTLKEAFRDYIFWAVEATQAQQQSARDYWIAQGYGADRVHIAPHPGENHMGVIVPHGVLHLRRPLHPTGLSTLVFPTVAKFRDAIDALMSRRIEVPVKEWRGDEWGKGNDLIFFKTPGGLFLWDHGYISNADFQNMANQVIGDTEPDLTV